MDCITSNCYDETFTRLENVVLIEMRYVIYNYISDGFTTYITIKYDFKMEIDFVIYLTLLILGMSFYYLFECLFSNR